MTQTRIRRVRAPAQAPSATEEREIDIPERLSGETEDEAAARIEAKYRDRAKSPLKAIRAFCVLCMGCQPREVGKCQAFECVLYPFRFGRNPYGKHKTIKPKK